MNYIKMFENFQEDLKKYLILSFFDVLVLVEIINIEYPENSIYKETVVLYKKLYTYRNKIREISKFLKNDLNGKPISEIKSKMVFQSDDLKECIDNLEVIMNTRKFNI